MIRTTEADLAAVVIAWLEALGDDVYQEVELVRRGIRADIVARVRAEIWIVETKTSVSLALIEQAMERRRFAHRVYIAAPPGRGRGGELLCDELGIGLLSVRGGSSNEPQVRELVKSRRWNSQPVRLAAKLCAQHKTHARAGAPTGGHWSPFRATVQRMTEIVAQHGTAGILVKAAITGIEHHYRSNAGARASLVHWVREGKVPGVRIDGDRLYAVETSS